MKKAHLLLLACLAAVILAASGFTWYMQRMMSMKAKSEEAAGSRHEYAKNLIEPRNNQPVKKYVLVAKESSLYIRDGLTIPVWTYNGTVPGTEIRVEQGDFVQIELRNELKEPVTIHWHGYPLLSAMDGVPWGQSGFCETGRDFHL